MIRATVVALAMMVEGTALGAVPAPFDYARGMLEQGVVLDDQAPGSYFYGNEGASAPEPDSWNDPRYKVQHEQEKQKDTLDSRGEEGVLLVAPADLK